MTIFHANKGFPGQQWIDNEHNGVLIRLLLLSNGLKICNEWKTCFCTAGTHQPYTQGLHTS